MKNLLMLSATLLMASPAFPQMVSAPSDRDEAYSNQELFQRRPMPGLAKDVQRSVVAFIGDTVFPQTVDGAGWKTSWTLCNLDKSTKYFKLLFFADDGSDLYLPIEDIGRVRRLEISLPVGGSVTVATTGLNSDLAQGWAYILKENYQDVVSGMSIFRQRLTGSMTAEAVVPVVSEFDDHFVLMYDNTTGYVTGMAIANPSTQRVLATANIRDEKGYILEQRGISLAAFEHKTYVVPTSWGSTAGKRGSIEFTAGGFGIGVLGLRFGSGSFTSFHVLSNISWIISK